MKNAYQILKLCEKYASRRITDMYHPMQIIHSKFEYNHSMVKILKIEIFFFVLLKSSEGFIEESECQLTAWTEWAEDGGTCGTVTRTRSYQYYMGEFFISQKKNS